MVLFREVRENKTLEMTLSFSDAGKSRPRREMVTSQICFNAIR